MELMISNSPIAEYVRNRSNEAFSTLVQQHVNLVYSSAYRQLGNQHQAEDVTQAVFILLSKKAAEIPADRPIAGWLLKTTRYVALNLRRELSTRSAHETKAATMKPESADDCNNKEWNDIAPLLDDGLSKLSNADRDALLLRFTENETLRETGQALGITEAAAEKRISRAIEKLRSFFISQGIPISSSALSLGLSSQFVTQAPRALLSAITSSPTTTSSVAAKLALTKTKAGIMTALNLKIAACVTVALAATGTGVAIVQHQQMQAQPSPVERMSTTPPAATQPAKEASADELYILKPDEPMHIIKDAPMAARLEMWNRMQTPEFTQGKGKQPLPKGPFVCNWNNGKPAYPMVYAENMQVPLDALLTTTITSTTAMKTYNVEFAGNFPSTLWEIPGDIIYTNSLPIDKTLASLQKMIREETGLPVTLSLQEVPREVYVVKGTFKYKASLSTNKKMIPRMSGQPNLAVLDLYGTDKIDDSQPTGSMSMGAGNSPMSEKILAGFVFGQVSSWIGDQEIIDESTGWPHAIGMREFTPTALPLIGTYPAHDPEKVLQHLCEQAGLTCARETRIVPRVMVSMDEKK